MGRGHGPRTIDLGHVHAILDFFSREEEVIEKGNGLVTLRNDLHTTLYFLSREKEVNEKGKGLVTLGNGLLTPSSEES